MATHSYLVIVDFKKAFDTLIRDVILQVLKEHKVPKMTVNVIKVLHE
jgi:citrate lyase gamma subunit